MKNLKILVFIILKNENKRLFLALKTRGNKKHGKSHWYVVTGSKEKGETLKETVKREIKEETGLNIKNIKELNISWEYEWPKNSGKMHVEHAFIAETKKRKIILNVEHIKYKWLKKEDFIKKIYWYGESKNQLRKALKVK